MVVTPEAPVLLLVEKLSKTEIMVETDLYRAAIDAIVILEKAGHQARLAGGCVRDRLLGIPPKDYDVATSSLPQQTIRAFRRAGKKTIPTGIKHGTISYLSEVGTIEVTSLRRDVRTDGRHAEVKYGMGFEEDAARRDFTVNAMFEDRHQQIYDFFDGQQDLKQRRLVFVGNPPQRIKEDYLRIMRMFRFWAQLGLIPDNQTLETVKDHIDGLALISQDRVIVELLAIIDEEDISTLFKAMRDCRLFEIILTESPPLTDRQAKMVADMASLAKEHRRSARLAVIVNQLPHDQLTPTLRRLRVTNYLRWQITTLLIFIDRIKNLTTSTPREQVMSIIDQIELEYVGSFSTTFYHIWQKFNEGNNFLDNLAYMFDIEQQFANLRRLPIPVDGTMLIDFLGIEESPLIGQLLEKLKNSYRAGKWQSSTEGLALADRIYRR